MTKAERDSNQVTTLLGVLNTDGVTIAPLKINASTNILDISDGTSGSDFGQANAERDLNGVSVMLATSETDGTTPVQLYVDSNGKLLIDSN